MPPASPAEGGDAGSLRIPGTQYSTWHLEPLSPGRVLPSPDGRTTSHSAAFAGAWHGPVNRIRLLRPVATHPDHRCRRLGQAVVPPARHRMKAAGTPPATGAVLETSGWTERLPLCA